MPVLKKSVVFLQSHALCYSISTYFVLLYQVGYVWASVNSTGPKHCNPRENASRVCESVMGERKLRLLL